MSRLVRLAGAILALALIVGGGWWLVRGGALAGTGAPTGTATDDDAASTAQKTAAVERQTLTVTDELDADLGYAGDYQVVGGLNGTLTWTVAEGTVVTAGKRLYETNGRDRAILMYGTRPAWRTLEAGVDNGADILQLERNLKKLGYTRSGDKINTHWDARTTAAVKRWQKASGLPVDGIVDIGEVVFLPEAIRITSVEAALGTGVGPGGPLMSATSNRRVISLDLDTDDVDLLHVGTAVEVELPDGTTVDATVATVATVAETSTDQQGGTSTSLPVTITLDDATAAGGLDQAPVTVTVVRATRENVLTVPVNALLALLGGGYAVEVVDGETAGGAGGASANPSATSSASPAASSSTSAGTSTHLVRVEPGLFDNGNVEVTATGLEPGDLVVVPS
ncbi:MAG TPA: peptidoglycan-binding domain-containing protein [Candidatus Limnocylindrales bacterium]|nr:peptidoglycan-binding domain-containing protein [Candidatus Limnocylindrales bacterium]